MCQFDCHLYPIICANELSAESYALFYAHLIKHHRSNFKDANIPLPKSSAKISQLGVSDLSGTANETSVEASVSQEGLVAELHSAPGPDPRVETASGSDAVVQTILSPSSFGSCSRSTHIGSTTPTPADRVSISPRSSTSSAASNSPSLNATTPCSVASKFAPQQKASLDDNAVAQRSARKPVVSDLLKPHVACRKCRSLQHNEFALR